jgi:hypothetical protein
MACEDRQLTEAQRVAGYQNQRTGVTQAVRPFSGKPTIDNLIDYINRELQPAVRRTRDAVNDVYLQVADNAPSGNPLGFYFSTETGAADPTAGRIRLNASPQNTGTILRVSESNGRLVDVAPWLDVMAGGATTPLGVVTLTDAINPGRFIRFDLNTMTDQGVYWDLGVTPIESSHVDPFVDGGAVVLSFIPGVGGVTPATVPATSLSPIAGNTLLGNATASSAAPTAIPVNAVSVLGRSSGNLTNLTVTGGNQYLRSDSSGTIVAFAGIGLTSLPSIGPNQIYANITEGFAVPTNVALVDFAGDALEYDTATDQFNVRPSASVEILSDTLVRAALAGGEVTAPQNSNVLTIELGVVTLAKMADIAQSRLLGRAEGAGTGAPQALTPAEVIAIIDGEDATWTGAHSFTGAAHTVNVTGGILAQSTTGAVDIAATTTVEVGAGQTITLNGSSGVRVDTNTTQRLTIETAGAWDVGGSVGTASHVLRSAGAGTPPSWGELATAGLADDSVTNAKLAEMATNTVKANATSGTANPTDFAVGTNAVLGRVAGNIVAAQLVNDQITDGTIANAKLANMVEATVKGRALGAGTGAPQDLTGAQVGELVRFATVQTDVTGGTFACFFLSTSKVKRVIFTLTSVIHGFGLTGPLPLEDGQEFVAENSAPLGSGVTISFVQFSSSVVPAGSGYKLLLPTTQGTNGVGVILNPGESMVFRCTEGPSGLRVRSIGPRALSTVQNANTVLANATAAATVPTAVSVGTNTVLGRVAGDIVAAQLVTAQITDANVTDAKISNRTALSVFGRSANSSGVGADIAAASDGEVLRRSGTSVGFGTVATAGIADASVTLAKMANLTAGTVIGRQIDAGTGVPVALVGSEIAEIVRFSNVVTESTGGTLNNYNLSPLADVLRVTATAVISGIANGTTGRRIVVANGAAGGSGVTVDLLQFTTSSAGNRFLLPAIANLRLNPGDSVVLQHGVASNEWSGLNVGVRLTDGDKGDITVTASGATWTIDNDAVTNAKLRNSAALSVIGRSANSTGDPGDISASAASDAVLRESGSALSFGTIATGGIANNAVTLAKLATQATNTVLANATSGAAVPTAFAVGTNAVLGRVAGNIVAAQLVNAQITDGTILFAKIGDIAQSRIVGRAEGGGTGALQALTPTQTVAIIDGESPTWTGSHTFNGTTLTVSASGGVDITGNTSVTGAIEVVGSGGVNPGILYLHDGDGETISLQPVNITGAANPELWMSSHVGLEPINNVCSEVHDSFSSTISAASTTVSLFPSDTIPANSWRVGRTFTGVAHVIVTRGATLTSFNLRTICGLSGGFTDTVNTAVPTLTDNYTYRIEYMLTCLSVGGSGSFMQSVRIAGGSGALPSMGGSVDTSPHTIDTTTTQTITATVNMDASVAGTTMTRTTGYLVRTF